MAKDTEELVLSISADTRQILNAMKRLVGDVAASTSKIQGQFDALGKGVDKSMVTAMQTRINDMVGVGSRAAKEWNGVLAEQGKELDRLRAKYSPLFAAQQTYLASLKEIKVAHAIGALSAEEMATAIARQKAAFAANVSVLNGSGEAVARVGASAKLTAYQMLNLSRQGNDVITMFALGAPPMQIFASQAGQIYDALEQGPNGVRGSLKAIGESALSLATRFPLATAAIAAATAAFGAYIAFGGSDIKSLDEILKQHEDNIKRLGDAYDEVSGKQHNYASATANTVNALNDKSLKDAQNLLQGQVKEIFDGLYRIIGAGGGNQGPLQTVLQSQFEPFREAIEKLAESAKRGAPDIKTFQDEVTDLAKADPRRLNSVRDVLMSLSSEAAKTAATIPNLAKPISDMVDTVGKFQVELDKISSEPLRKELQALFDKAREGTPTIDEIKQALAKLQQANPDFSQIITEIRRITTEAYGASEAVANMYGQKASGSPNGRVFNPIAAQIEDAIARGANIIPTPSPNKEDLGAEYDKAVEKANRNSSHAPKKTAEDRMFDDMQALRDRTAALKEEQTMLGKSFYEQQKRAVSLDLEQEALRLVREEARKKGEQDWQNAQLSPDQRRQIDEVSEAYARQADELRKAQEAQDFQRDMLKGAFGDLRSALEDGKLDWKDLGDIAMSALDKIIDKIENDLIDAIMQANSAADGSGGGLLGLLTKGLGALLGGGSGFTPNTTLAGVLGVPGYAEGTNNHPGGLAIVGEKGPELLNLPRGSQVIPQLPQMPSFRGTSQQATRQEVHVTVGWSRSADGNLTPLIEQVSQKNAQAVVARYDKGSAYRTSRALGEVAERGYGG